MAKLFANSEDPVASDMGLHCLPFTLLGVSRLQGMNSLTLTHSLMETDSVAVDLYSQLTASL